MDIHPPTGGIHSWREVFIHLGIVVAGILIAIGLEQSVEAIHHHHQREVIERDIQADLQANVGRVEYDMQIMATMRSALLEPRAAVDARRAGASVSTPDVAAHRSVAAVAPSFAAWDAARQSGTLGLLPDPDIRIYNRFAFQLDRMGSAITDFEKSALDLQSFEERFQDSPGAFDLHTEDPVPDIRKMSPDDLAEYSRLLSNMIKSLDRLVLRIHYVGMEDRALLSGTHNEEQMLHQMETQANTAPSP